jgi:UTP--glucose-1-phosphate uridylyltransferase
MKAVIPAAGLGTRMLPATKSMPKEMLPVVDKPVIQYVVEEAVQAGFDEILIVTGRGKRAVEDHFDYSVELESFLKMKGKEDQLKQMKAISEMADIHYVRQKEPLGLGHAVLCAKTFVGDDDFAVLLGDDIFLGSPSPTAALAKVHEEFDAPCFAVLQVATSEISRYGSIKPERVRAGLHRVRGMVEKPKAEAAPSLLAAMGRYLFTPDIFHLLRMTKPGVGGEIQLTDAMAQLAAKREMLAVETTCRRLDVGSLEGFIEANLYMALRRPGMDGAGLAARLLDERRREGR